MPTAQEYRRAAARFRTGVDHATRHALAAARWPVANHLSGPPAEATADTLREAAAHLETAAAELAAIASECDRRADVCEGFHAQLRAHRELHADVRAIVPPPIRPFPWVD